MTMWRRILSGVVFVSLAAAGPGTADDTEIYFGAVVSPGTQVRPNVLFVLDTSSSMTNTDGGTVTRLDRMKAALHQVLDASTGINVGLMRFHRIGGPVLYPVTDIEATAEYVEGGATSQYPDVIARIAASSDDVEEDGTGVVLLDSEKLELGDLPPGAETTVEVRVSGSSDDAEEVAQGASTAVNLTSTDLELPREGSTQQIVGIRFQGVDIPLGATITSAIIEFEVDETKGGNENNSINLAIAVQDADDAPGFEAIDGNISGRNTTGTTVSWPDAANPAIDEKLVTPDITPLVADIVARPGWVAGNSMVFIVTRVSGNGNRTVEAFDGEETAAPLLRVTYQTGDAGPQVVGLRFQDIGVPQGATVESAVLEFNAGGVDSDTGTNLRVHGIAEDDMPAFSGTTNEVTSLTTTTSSADWNAGSTPALAAWTATDVTHQSPDVTGIVQEIVNRAGWCGGNAMAFKVGVNAGSTGKRTAFSFDSDPARAPVLRVTWNFDTPQDGASGCWNREIATRVSQSNDDAEESVSVDLASSDLELVNDPARGDQSIGVMFRNIQLPQGATILGADLTFTTDETTSGTAALTIWGDDSDSAQDFSQETVKNRSKTNASVTWDASSTPALNDWDAVGAQHVTPDLKDVVQAIVNRAGWSLGSNLAFIIEGSGHRVAESYDGDPGKAPLLRIRYEHDPGALPTTITVRERMHQIVDELQYKFGTPILSTLVEATNYYHGSPVHYGLKRGDTLGDGDGVRSEYSRVSHPVSWGGDQADINRTEPCSVENPNDVSCVSEFIDPDGDGAFSTDNAPEYVSPITADCQTSYVVLLSDGLGYIDELETGTWEPTQYVHSITGNSACSDHDTCSTALAAYLSTNDQSDLPGDQVIRTYTVGFNLGDTDPQFLRDIAQAGNGSFYEAESAEQLADVFQTIIAEAQSAPTSFTAPSLSVNAFNRLFNRSDVFFALFEPSAAKRWIGNVKKFSICSGEPDAACTLNGAQLGDVIDAADRPAIGGDSRIRTTARSIWSTTQDGPTVDEGGAGGVQQSRGHDPSVRNVYTYTGTDFSPATPVALNGADHDVVTANTALTKDLLGDAAMDDTTRENIINWMRGQDVLDEDGDGGTTDTRWLYADPLHSRPLTVTFGAPACTASDIADADSACYGRTTSARNADKAVIKLFVGTNDGVLRMINEKTGEEEWSFIVPDMLTDQQELMNNTDGDHIYGVDGTPSALIIDNDEDGVIEPGGSNNDKVYVFVGMRRGGNSIYALDVTPTSELTNNTSLTGITPKFMWRITGGAGDFGQLGQTWSRPIPMRIRYGTGGNNSEIRPVLVFGGGYDTGQDVLGSSLLTADGDTVHHGSDGVGNAVYIVDPVTGDRIWWAGANGSGADLELAEMSYGIPGDIAGLDSDGDGAVDRLYFADVGGQVWRIDLAPTLSASSPGGSTGGRLATLANPTLLTGEIDKRKFFYAPDVAQMRETQVSFASFAEYDMVTIASGNRAHPLDLDVQNRIYALRDYLIEERIAMDATTDLPTNYPQCISNSSTRAYCGSPLTESNLVDTTANVIQEGNTTEIADQQGAFKLAEGWFIKLQELDGSWVGEKGLSQTLILDGILFASTFVPTQAGNPCQGSEGTGRLFAVGVTTGEAIFDWSADGTITRADRVLQLGGGIPSEVVPVFQEQGVTLLIGTGAGASRVNPNIGLPRDMTFWYQSY